MLRIILYHLSLIAVFLWDCSLLAVISGGMDSGGGASFTQDTHNPWFLENTREVKYCIRLDEENFGVDRSLSNQKIQEALSYWKSSFRFSRQDFFKLATQDLIESPCEVSDLIFQLGTLTKEQESLFIDPTDYIARTVRTSYDRKSLKAKGFIYIAPEKGKLRPRGDGYHENYWQFEEGALLYRVLVHELGHVFGLQHESTSIYINDSPMAESYPNMVLQKTYSEITQSPLENFFGFANKERIIDRCYPIPAERKPHIFFFVDYEKPCLRVQFHEVGSNKYLSIESAYSKGGPYTREGIAPVTMIGKYRLPSVVIHIPKESSTFYKRGASYLVTGRKENHFYASYKKEGKERQFNGILSWDKPKQHIGAFLQGKHYKFN